MRSRTLCVPTPKECGGTANRWRTATGTAAPNSAGLMQEAFALRYGFNLGRLRDLEQKRTRPDSVVPAYFLVIQKNPEAVKDTLAA